MQSRASTPHCPPSRRGSKQKGSRIYLLHILCVPDPTDEENRACDVKRYGPSRCLARSTRSCSASFYTHMRMCVLLWTVFYSSASWILHIQTAVLLSRPRRHKSKQGGHQERGHHRVASLATSQRRVCLAWPAIVDVCDLSPPVRIKTLNPRLSPVSVSPRLLQPIQKPKPLFPCCPSRPLCSLPTPLLSSTRYVSPV